MARQALLIVGLLVAAYPLTPAVAQQQKIGAPPEASNMQLVGWTEPLARNDTPLFLRDFYTAQRAFLEREQLFGRPRADKFDAAQKR